MTRHSKEPIRMLTKAQQRRLYFMLRSDDLGGNRGREFYDGQCQTCNGGYEFHTDDCEWMAMLIALGGAEERARQDAMRDRREAEKCAHKETLARHRRGVTTSSLDAMNLAFKKAYGGFGE